MTPRFITACYVRVDDKDKRKEVCARLEKMGYKSTLSAEHNSWGNLIVVRRYGVIQNTGIEYGELPKHLINCGTNIDLFLALAGMREDTEFNHINPFVGGGMGEQWFIADKSYTDEFSGDEVFKGTMSIANFITCCSKSSKYWRKATAAEIIEHFKNIPICNKL